MPDLVCTPTAMCYTVATDPPENKASRPNVGRLVQERRARQPLTAVTRSTAVTRQIPGIFGSRQGGPVMVYPSGRRMRSTRLLQAPVLVLVVIACGLATI